ncbi:MAG: tetratricopeptide repeat protein [Ignavibacteriaceae bacterium]|nr:tetratricopeptide repeat protein [Ignavibacteriaceae bacterium]
MKFKLRYLYGALLLIVVLTFFLVNNNNDKQKALLTGEIENKEMPDDAVHKGLENSNSPNKSNVSSSVFERLEKMKSEVAQNPTDTSKLKELADFLTAAHKPDEAIPYYEKILKIDPINIDVLFNLSYIYNNKLDFVRAETYTNRILKLEPANTQAIYNLGAIFASKGQKEKAKVIWEKLVKNYPGSPASDLAKTSLNKL